VKRLKKITCRKGPATNLRPAGIHKDQFKKKENLNNDRQIQEAISKAKELYEEFDKQNPVEK
jgi:hypothetical protein